MRPSAGSWYRSGKQLRGLDTGECFLVEHHYAGGEGEVYRARRIRDNSVCALKTLKREKWNQKSDDERVGFVKEFAEEVHTMTLLGKHRNIVQSLWFEAGMLFDSEAHYVPAMVMEYVHGGDEQSTTLADRIASGRPLDVPDTLDISIQTLTGILYAQRVTRQKLGKEFVHQDLKPANLLLGSSNTVKVGDFGLARAAGSPAGGTSAYMACEQWEDGQITEQTDVYSVGCILSEMILGRQPFQGTEYELRRAHCEMPPSVPLSRATDERLPADLREVLLHCLAKSPKQRPSVDELRGKLQNIHLRIAGVPVAVCDEPMPLEADDWFRLGMAYDGLGKYEQAVECYDCAIGVDGSPAKYQCNKAQSLCRLGAAGQAIDILQKILPSVEEDRRAKVQVSLGYAFLIEHKLDDAMTHLNSAEQTNPSLPNTYLVRGTVLTYQCLLRGAEEDFKRAGNLGLPAEAYQGLGDLYRHGHRDLVKARYWYEKALLLNPCLIQARQAIEEMDKEN